MMTVLLDWSDPWAAPGVASPTATARVRLLQPHLENDLSLSRLAAEAGVSERMLATRRPRTIMAAIHRKAAVEAKARGFVEPSYAVVADVAREVRAAGIAVATDAAGYRDRYEFVHRPDAAAPNGMWQADHTMLNILVLDERCVPVRPWLTVVMDDYSRAVMGYMLATDTPSAANTALALRQAIWRKSDPVWPVRGIPEGIYVDKGSDVVSEQIEQACIALKIRLVPSRPGRPCGRGKAERLFRTVDEMFLPDLPGHLSPADSGHIQSGCGQELAPAPAAREGGSALDPYLR